MAFHFAADVPIYATSQAASDTASANDLGDLNGFRMTELPWQVYPSAIRNEVEVRVCQFSHVPVAPLRTRCRRIPAERSGRSADPQFARPTCSAKQDNCRFRAPASWLASPRGQSCNMARSWPCPPWRLDATTAELGRRAERAAETLPHAARLTHDRTQLPHPRWRDRSGDDSMTTRWCSSRYVSAAAPISAMAPTRSISASSNASFVPLDTICVNTRDDERPCRFDVVSVGRTHYRLRFEWMRNAFTP